MSRSVAAKAIRNETAASGLAVDIGSLVLELAGSLKVVWIVSTLFYGMPAMAPVAMGGNKIFASRESAESALQMAVQEFNRFSSTQAAHLDGDYFVPANKVHESIFPRALDDGAILLWVPRDSRFREIGMDGPICVKPMEIFI